MSDLMLIKKSTLTEIADAVREKTGSTDTIKVDELAGGVSALPVVKNVDEFPTSDVDFNSVYKKIITTSEYELWAVVDPSIMGEGLVNYGEIAASQGMVFTITPVKNLDSVTNPKVTNDTSFYIYLTEDEGVGYIYLDFNGSGNPAWTPFKNLLQGFGELIEVVTTEPPSETDTYGLYWVDKSSTSCEYGIADSEADIYNYSETVEVKMYTALDGWTNYIDELNLFVSAIGSTQLRYSGYKAVENLPDNPDVTIVYVVTSENKVYMNNFGGAFDAELNTWCADSNSVYFIDDYNDIDVSSGNVNGLYVKHKVSWDSISKDLIEVEEFPTDNVDTNKVYKKTVIPREIELWAVQDDTGIFVTNVIDYLRALGGRASLTVVDSLDTVFNPIVSDYSNSEWYIYFSKTEGTGYIYRCTDATSGTYEWVSYNEKNLEEYHVTEIPSETDAIGLYWVDKPISNYECWMVVNGEATNVLSYLIEQGVSATIIPIGIPVELYEVTQNPLITDEQSGTHIYIPEYEGIGYVYNGSDFVPFINAINSSGYSFDVEYKVATPPLPTDATGLYWVNKPIIANYEYGVSDSEAEIYAYSEQDGWQRVELGLMSVSEFPALDVDTSFVYKKTTTSGGYECLIAMDGQPIDAINMLKSQGMNATLTAVDSLDSVTNPLVTDGESEIHVYIPKSEGFGYIYGPFGDDGSNIWMKFSVLMGGEDIPNVVVTEVPSILAEYTLYWVKPSSSVEYGIPDSEAKIYNYSDPKGVMLYYEGAWADLLTLMKRENNPTLKDYLVVDTIPDESERDKKYMYIVKSDNSYWMYDYSTINAWIGRDDCTYIEDPTILPENPEDNQAVVYYGNARWTVIPKDLIEVESFPINNVDTDKVYKKIVNETVCSNVLVVATSQVTTLSNALFGRSGGEVIQVDSITSVTNPIVSLRDSTESAVFYLAMDEGTAYVYLSRENGEFPNVDGDSNTPVKAKDLLSGFGVENDYFVSEAPTASDPSGLYYVMDGVVSNFEYGIANINAKIYAFDGTKWIEGTFVETTTE